MSVYGHKINTTQHTAGMCLKEIRLSHEPPVNINNTAKLEELIAIRSEPPNADRL
jgi:hypothetical protein